MPPPSHCENRPSDPWAIASPELIMPSSRIADGWCTTTDMQPTRMRLALVASRTRSGREQDGCCVSRMSETNLRFS